MSIIVVDTFNRVDSPASLGTADTGQVWSQVLGAAGAFGINSNQALWTWNFPDGPVVHAVLESGISDVHVEVRLINPNDTTPIFGIGAGIIFRYVDSDYYWQLVYYLFPGGSRIRLQRTYAGGLTSTLDLPLTLSNGDRIGVTCCHDDFEIFANDISLGTYNDGLNPQNYGTKCGILAGSGTFFSTILRRFDDFIVETVPGCNPSSSPSLSPSPSASPSSSPSASQEPCTPPIGRAISCVNARGRLFVTLASDDFTSQIAYAWHEGAERMPITSMTNWKGSRRALTLQELGLAFETDNADPLNPLIVSVHRNLRKNYIRDARVTAGSNRIDSLTAGFDADHVGDMIVCFGENIGGPGVNYILGRIEALASPSASPSPSASLSASPSTTESASPSGSPSASPSSSRSGSPSPSHSPSSSPSASPSRSPSASPSATASSSPSASPSSSQSASPSAS